MFHKRLLLHLRTDIYGLRTPLYGPYLKFPVHKKHISHSQPERNTLSSTNEMQFTDRELGVFETRNGEMPKWRNDEMVEMLDQCLLFSFSFGFNYFSFPKRKQLLNFIYIISPFRHFVISPFRVLNTPNSSIRTVSEVHGPCKLYGP